MEELTIEQKAKRYDEAIKEAFIAHKNEDRHLKATLERIFPVLKESEDEKIRKWLIELVEEVRKANPTNANHNGDCSEAIAWLEKQGEQKSILDFKATDWYVSKGDGKIHNIYRSVDTVEPKFKVKYAGDEYNVFFIKDFTGVTYYGIEDEPNHIDYVKAEDCEIISEQKSADKVEPKFGIRDWIIHQGTENVYQVVAIVDNQYQIRYNNNYTLQKCTDVDRCARLWDVTKDAKDGDALVASDGSIFLFKCVVNCSCKYYVALTNINTIKFNEGLEHCWETTRAVHPATEEQRATLMKAIVNAGYIFDVYNKELKKITKV